LTSRQRRSCMIGRKLVVFYSGGPSLLAHIPSDLWITRPVCITAEFRAEGQHARMNERKCNLANVMLSERPWKSGTSAAISYQMETPSVVSDGRGCCLARSIARQSAGEPGMPGVAVAKVGRYLGIQVALPCRKATGFPLRYSHTKALKDTPS
jgi:hypothetical protein